MVAPSPRGTPATGARNGGNDGCAMWTPHETNRARHPVQDRRPSPLHRAYARRGTSLPSEASRIRLPSAGLATRSIVDAPHHVERSGQTVPHWPTNALFGVVIRGMTNDEMRRARERWWAARRYTCVRDLRQKGYTKHRALDQAVIDLRAEGDKGVKRQGKLDEGVSRDTVESSYDKVRKDLERRGRESQYYIFVNKTDEGVAISYPSG